MNEAVVHIVDDDEATRDSLRFLLASAGIGALTHPTATDFAAALPIPGAACVITDVRMPDMSGIDLLKIVRSKQPGLPVIVITGHGDVALAVEAMKLGAVDFLEKPYAEGAILAAVDDAIKRSRSTDTRTHDADIVSRIQSLSPRERQVLKGVVGGKSNKIIAHELDISPRTVEVYRANLMAKMQATSLSQLVRMALVTGLDETD